MKEKEMSDIVFVAEIMSAARLIAAMDTDRIKKLINEKDRPGAVLKPYAKKDTVTPRIAACMAIMAFAAKELKELVPPQEDVAAGTDSIIETLPEEYRAKAREMVEKLREEYSEA